MRYSASLDGVRGIAVIAVVLAHFGVPFIRRGGLGVDIFFTLSGFLITSILLHEHARTGDISFRNFYMRRLLRLLPALLFLLAVYGFCVLVLDKDLNRHFTDIALVLFYLANWASAAGLNRPGELGHTWSLSVEEQFYLLWPCVLYFLLNKWGRRGLFCGGVVLAGLSMLETFSLAQSVPWWRLYYGSDTRAFTMLWGCCFAMMFHFWREKVVLPRLLEAVLPLLTWGGIAFMMLHSDSFLQEPDFFRGKIFIIPVLTCALLYQVVMPGFDLSKRILSAKVLVYFGKRSYGLYLWHYWIMNYWLMDISKESSPGIRILWALASLIVTELSYRYVELPFLSLKDRFSWSKGTAVAEPVGKPAVA